MKFVFCEIQKLHFTSCFYMFDWYICDLVGKSEKPHPRRFWISSAQHEENSPKQPFRAILPPCFSRLSWLVIVWCFQMSTMFLNGVREVFYIFHTQLNGRKKNVSPKPRAGTRKFKSELDGACVKTLILNGGRDVFKHCGRKPSKRWREMQTDVDIQRYSRHFS